MVGFFERKQSVAAIWCYRFAIILPAYFILSVLLHRFGKIETPQLFALLAIGLVITLISVVLAIRAMTDLWNKGHKGGKSTVKALIIALLVLIPFGYYIGLALALPLASDVSTNYFSPPDFDKIADIRQAGSARGMNQLEEYDTDYARELVQAYPRLGPRRYPAGADRVLQAVKLVIADQGYEVLSTRGAPDITLPDAEPTELADNQPKEGEVASEDDSEAIGETPDDILIEVTIASLIVGYRNDAVIRIVSEDVNTLVDMRSSSRWGSHDFGSNAALIDKFLAQLDLALLGIAGEG